jgi:uncharacterized protein YecT (DUF1311 family)
MGHAESHQKDVDAVLACVFKNGAAKAALNQPVGCQGMISGPCLPDAPNTSETLDCIARESAAWTTIMNNAFAEAQAKLPKAKFNALRRRQQKWLKQLPSLCVSEDEGSLALVEKQFCHLGQTAKRATDLYEVAKHAKK